MLKSTVVSVIPLVTSAAMANGSRVYEYYLVRMPDVLAREWRCVGLVPSHQSLAYAKFVAKLA